jgi:hypothetical protein
MKKLPYLIAVLMLFASFAKAQEQKYVDPDLKRGIHPGTVTTLDKQALRLCWNCLQQTGW